MTSPLPARRDPSTPEALRRGLDALSAIDAPYDVAAGAARFEARLSGAPAPVAATRGTGLAKVFVVVALVVLGAAAVMSLGREHNQPAEAKAVAAIDVEAPPEHEPPQPVVTPTPPEVPAVPAAPDPPSSEPPDEQPPEQVERRKPKPAAVPEEEPPEDPLMREMKLLNATRKHVAADRNADALTSIAEARELPTRRFDEEWQALEILALAGAGKVDRARALAEPYLARHEGGRFNASIEKALGKP